MSGFDAPTGPIDWSGRRPRRRTGRTAALALAAVVAVSALTIGVLLYTGQVTPSPAVASADTPTATSTGAESSESGAPAAGQGPATTDNTGAALPPAVVASAGRLYTALSVDDLSTVEGCYAPDPRARVAPWATVAARLASPPTRQGLLAALRTPPSRPGDVAYLFAHNNLGIGLRTDGKAAFFGTGQGQTSSAPAGPPTASPAGPAGADPVLGDPSWGYEVVGFGVARPPEVNADGDGTSYINSVRWRSWGGPQAVGTGIAYWVPPDAVDMTHGQDLPARVIASDLGPCHGHLGYRKVAWYFPSKGETLADAGGYDHICDPS